MWKFSEFCTTFKRSKNLERFEIMTRLPINSRKSNYFLFFYKLVLFISPRPIVNIIIPRESQVANKQTQENNVVFKGTDRRNFKWPPCVGGNVRFTTIFYTPLSRNKLWKILSRKQLFINGGLRVYKILQTFKIFIF